MQAQPSPPLKHADLLASHREANMRTQHFFFESELFDSNLYDHLMALNVILALNQGMQLDEDFSYRGSVFIGSEETAMLQLHWLALLFCEPNNGRLRFQTYPCQINTAMSRYELISHIQSIRTGHETNPGSLNRSQQQRWADASKLVANLQMPISIITLATCHKTDPHALNLRLFVPHEPEMVFNTMALKKWRLAISPL